MRVYMVQTYQSRSKDTRGYRLLTVTTEGLLTDVTGQLSKGIQDSYCAVRSVYESVGASPHLDAASLSAELGERHTVVRL